MYDMYDTVIDVKLYTNGREGGTRRFSTTYQVLCRYGDRRWGLYQGGGGEWIYLPTRIYLHSSVKQLKEMDRTKQPLNKKKKQKKAERERWSARSVQHIQ